MRSARKFYTDFNGYPEFMGDPSWDDGISTKNIGQWMIILQAALDEGYTKGCAEVVNRDAKITQLEHEKRDIQNYLNQRDQRIVSLEISGNSLNQTIAALKNQLANEKNVSTQAISALNNQISKLNSTLNSERTNAASTLVAKENRHKSEIVEISNQLAKANLSAKQQQSAIKDYQKRLDTAQLNLMYARTEESCLAHEIKKLKEKMKQEQAHFAKKDAQLDKAYSNSNRDTFEHFSTEMEKLELNVEKEKFQTAEAEHTANVLRSRLKISEMTAEELKMALKKSELTVRTLQKNVNQSNEETDKLKIEIDSLRSILKKLQNENQKPVENSNQATLSIEKSASDLKGNVSSSIRSSLFFRELTKPSEIESYKKQQSRSSYSTTSMRGN